MPILHPYEAFDFLNDQKGNGRYTTLNAFLVTHAKKIQIGSNPRKVELAIAFGKTVNNENKRIKLCEVPEDQMLNSFAYSVKNAECKNPINNNVNEERKTQRGDEKFKFADFFKNPSGKIFICELYKIAVVSIAKEKNEELMDLYMMLLVLSALDYKLVACSQTLNIPKQFFEKLFIEFHFFAKDEKADIKNIENFDKCRYTFYYVYANFSCTKIKDSSNPYVKIMNYSGDIKGALDNNIFSRLSSNNDTSLIPIIVYNIPLYKNSDDITPSYFTGKSVIYIQFKQFERWSPKRAEVFLGKSPRYADFSCLHEFKPELCVKDQVCLSNAQDIIDSVRTITKDLLDLKKSGKFKIKDISRIIINKVPKKVFRIFNNFMCRFHQKGEDFDIRDSQIFAVYEAVESIIKNLGIDDTKKDKNDENRTKGNIYQIDTGEGKTYIISAIAAIVASMDNKVHVASSNIELAYRDWQEFKDNFDILGIKSALLIHKSEREMIESKNQGKTEEEKKEPENSSDMNINCFNDAQVVFSTFLNFEGAYLHLLESDQKKAAEIKEKVLLIDEADNMLIDEIANGTILSKEIKSNVEEVLKYLYDKMKNIKDIEKDAESLMKDVNEKYKKCMFEKNDIKQLYGDYKSAHEKKLNVDYIIDKNTKEIIPFDSENKGMVEPSKEFMGCIQQFIAIKENKRLGKKIPAKEKYLKYLYDKMKGIEDIEKEAEKLMNDVNEKYKECNLKENDIKQLHSDYKSAHEKKLNKDYIIDPDTKEIIPCDPSKKFDGCIQQFIAIKENKRYEEGLPVKEKVLKYLYEKMKNVNNIKKDAESLLKGVNEKYKECKLKESDIKQLYSDYKSAHKKELKVDYNVDPKTKEIIPCDPSKKFEGCIQQFIAIKENKRSEKKIPAKEKYLKYLYDKMKGIEDIEKEAEKLMNDVNEKYKECNLKENDIKQLHSDYKSAHEKKLNKDYIIDPDTKEIIPCDPSKKFEGCIQQFIAFKEEIVKIRPLSFTTMYISHQIYVANYKYICGFTGTIGNEIDKKIFKEKYRLGTFKIQRNKPNLRVDLPKLVAKNEEEKFKLIIDEVKHKTEKRRHPVLIIFQEINEIKRFEEKLKSAISRVKYQIFDGTEGIDQEKLKQCGNPGAITLATNCLGRGTDIKTMISLHIIFTYNTPNERVIYQAFGRTARDGNQGSARIICTKESNRNAEIEKRQILEEKSKTKMDSAYGSLLSMFEKRSEKQNEFIQIINNYIPWIFYPKESFKELPTNDQLLKIRKNEIVVSRDTASDFEFPVCLKLDRFINIQRQRIASLYNCPNTTFTWFMVAKYFRELVLVSWSILTDDRTGSINETTINNVIEKLKEVIPGLKNEIPKKPKNLNIFDCFINVMKHVKGKYYSKIYSEKPKFNYSFDSLKKFLDIINFYEIGTKTGVIMQNTGEYSGIRLNKGQIIKDKQYRYQTKDGKEISISKKADKLIDSLYDLFQAKFGDKDVNVYFKRTLAGPEMGIFIDKVCLDKWVPKYKDPDMLCDVHPIFTSSLCIRSSKSLLTGIIVKYLLNNGLTEITGWEASGISNLLNTKAIGKNLKKSEDKSKKQLHVQSIIASSEVKKEFEIYKETFKEKDTETKAKIVLYAYTQFKSIPNSGWIDETDTADKYEEGMKN